MKDLLKIAGIFALFVLIIPMAGLIASSEEKSSAEENVSSIYSGTESASAASAGSAEELPSETSFKVLDFTSGQVMEMSVYDYVKGAVMGEMPAGYHEEALKAQAVAAHTYAVRKMEQQLNNPDPELMGAYISNDSAKYQAYFTPEQAKSFYGDAYDAYDEKVSAAVDAVINEILVYDGEPIVAAFHAISAGETESAEVVWGTPLDYLVPVSAEEDKSAPTYLDEKEFSFDELEARLYAAFEIALPKDAENPLKITETSPSGTVLTVAVGDKTLTGAEMRVLLNLKSACFSVDYDKQEAKFVFTTKGSGHGVGLSQYGANAMAENGSDYKEILLHYYSGAEIVSLE